MLDKTVKVKEKETTEAGTLVVTLYPQAYVRYKQTEALTEAEVAVQPYGVFLIPSAVVSDSSGLNAVMLLDNVLYTLPLASIISADEEDELTFSAPYMNLEDLQNVNITSATNGQALIYNTSSGKWKNGSAGATTLNGLNNVNITTPTNGQALIYDNTSSKWVNGSAGVSTLSALTDTTITTPTNGQVLTYDSTANKWKNANASGGSAGYTYSTSEIYDGTLQMTDQGEGNYGAVLPESVIFVAGSLYDITVNDMHLIAVAVESEGSVYISNEELGITLGTEEGVSFLALYSPNATVTTAVTEITLISLTVTDGFKKAIGASTIILECDNTGEGTVLSPYGLTDVDAGNIDWLITQNVIIKDPDGTNGYWYPTHSSGVGSSFMGFVVVTGQSTLYFGFKTNK